MANRFEIGVPGGSLAHTKKFDSEARKVGVLGEQRTAAALRAVQQRRPFEERFTVLHDLMVDAGEYEVNVDHVIVAGSSVVILDSKVWAPGWYVTVKGQTWVVRSRQDAKRRGERLPVQRAEYADHLTLPMVARILGQIVTPVHGKVARAVVVVWPPAQREPRLTFYRPQGATAINSSRVVRHLDATLPRAPADPRVVSRLAPLCFNTGER